MRLIWSDRSIRHLGEIISYISLEDPAAAQRVATRIVTLTETVLPEQPLIGRTGRVDGTHELIVSRTPYIVAYEFNDEIITILAVIHAARKWPSIF